MKTHRLYYDPKHQCFCFIIEAPCDLSHLFEIYHVSKKMRYRYYTEHAVRLNDQTILQNQSLQIGDRLCIASLTDDEPINAWNHPLHICFEDDCFLVVDKPVSLLVHSDGVNQIHTLHNQVQAYYQNHQIHSPVRSIHRLDQETSGLVLYCKQMFLQAYMDQLLAEKKIERIYLAWVKGVIREDMRIIDQPLGRDRHNAKKMRIHTGGKQACTIIHVKQRKKDATLVECRLKTGRTHQIRVHLASIHHPILSDSLYGCHDPRINRCALHAWKLHFYHPVNRIMQEVICPLPHDMAVLEQLPDE